MPAASYDAVIVGAGPNGLAAAAILGAAGRSVLVLEARDTIGGGCRSAAITLPGFVHDLCAAIHATGMASPVFSELQLEQHGLRWVRSPGAVAHPLDDGTAALLSRSIDDTGLTLGEDASAWKSLMQPYVSRAAALFGDVFRPVRFPKHPLLMARFGALGLRSCASLVRSKFRSAHARALFAGCAAHSFLSMDAPGSASFGLVLAITGHAVDWPCAEGGSQRIVDAMAARVRSLGGEIRTGIEVRSLADVPASRAVLFDVSPHQLERIAGDALPASYRRQLRQYRLGPSVFKIDYALRGPIPWTAPECHRSATVHVGGTFEEIATSEHAATHGQVADKPFVLVAQQSLFDPTRAPAGHHTGWAYCHVPHGSTVDYTPMIERQLERFAPGFRDLVLARSVRTPADIAAHNANMIGGDISGGANDLRQLVFRPVVRMNPYTTPNERIYLCSSSTPPGGGVHGMCGYLAAQAALRRALR